MTRPVRSRYEDFTPLESVDGTLQTRRHAVFPCQEAPHAAPRGRGRLSCLPHRRSVDIFLGVPGLSGMPPTRH